MVEEGFSEDVGGEDITPVKKGALPPLLIIIIIAVIMGVGGFFAGKILSGGDDQKPPVTQTDTQETTQAQEDQQGTTTEPGIATEEEKTGDEGKKDSGKKKGLLVLDAFTVNLNDPFGRRYAEVVVNLVIDDKEFVPEITENELIMPRLRDEIFMIISGKSYQELRSTSGKVTLKEEVQMRINEIMKEEFDREPVTGVLFTKFLIQ